MSLSEGGQSARHHSSSHATGGPTDSKPRPHGLITRSGDGYVETMAQLIICEKRGIWAAALRWHQKSHRISMLGTRSLMDARSELQRAPDSVAALEATTASVEGVLRLLLESRLAWPRSRIIVLLTNEVAGFDELCWESGAALVVVSPRRLDLVMRFVQKCLAMQEPLEMTMRERVWTELPWNGNHP
jgi:hypothetical protein